MRGGEADIKRKQKDTSNKGKETSSRLLSDHIDGACGSPAGVVSLCTAPMGSRMESHMEPP